MLYSTSLDKIKLTFKLNKPNYQGLQQFHAYAHKHYFCSDVIKDNRPFHYAYALKISPVKDGEVAEGVFYLAFNYNGGCGQKNDPRRVIVEFNPNKGTTIFENFKYFCDVKCVELNSFDIAWDFPVTFDKLVVNPVNSTHWSFGEKGNYTHYLAPKSKNGRIKCYDKQHERKQLGVEIPPTTRIECSFHGLDLNVGKYSSWGDTLGVKLSSALDEVCYRLSQVGILENETTNPLVVLLLKATPTDRSAYLTAVSHVTRKKLRDEISYCLFRLDYDYSTLYSLIIELTKKYTM